MRTSGLLPSETGVKLSSNPPGKYKPIEIKSPAEMAATMHPYLK
jgi:hypothetical protein